MWMGKAMMIKSSIRERRRGSRRPSFDSRESYESQATTVLYPFYIKALLWIGSSVHTCVHPSHSSTLLPPVQLPAISTLALPFK